MVLEAQPENPPAPWHTARPVIPRNRQRARRFCGWRLTAVPLLVPLGSSIWVLGLPLANLETALVLACARRGRARPSKVP